MCVGRIGETMTKQELNRYFWLNHEIRRQKKRLERLEDKLSRQNDTVGDTVRDYRSGKGIPVRIEGIPTDAFTLPVMIRLLEEEIRKNIKESERAVVAIEKYVQNINDPKVRELMRSRFIDCLSWEEVGAQNFINADYARQLINKHIKQI